MNLLAGIKALGGGIASIPRRLNEARFDHANVNVSRTVSNGGEDDLIVIGKDPDTGEDITIPRNEFGGFGVGPATHQVMGQNQVVRTGPSKFGNFLKNGLPRMLDAGIAAATSPGDGSGGFLAAMKGMDIGRDRLQRRDAIAYQMRRQAMNDAALDEQRRSAAKENRMQAEMYRRKMDAPPADPHPPTTFEAALTQAWLKETDPAKKKVLADKLTALRLKGQAWGATGQGPIFNHETGEFAYPDQQRIPVKDGSTPRPLTAAQIATRDSKAAADSYLMRGSQNIDKALQLAKEENASGDVQTRLLDLKKRSAPAARPGGRGPQRTPIQQDALNAHKQADDFLRRANQSYEAAIALAQKENAPGVVQGILADLKKKVAPPVKPATGGQRPFSRNPIGAKPDAAPAGNIPTWMRFSAQYPGAK